MIKCGLHQLCFLISCNNQRFPYQLDNHVSSVWTTWGPVHTITLPSLWTLFFFFKYSAMYFHRTCENFALPGLLLFNEIHFKVVNEFTSTDWAGDRQTYIHECLIAWDMLVLGRLTGKIKKFLCSSQVVKHAPSSKIMYLKIRLKKCVVKYQSIQRYLGPQQ